MLEVVDDEDGDTFRAVYTVRFAGVIYVLHGFQKKSKRGIETPKHDIQVRLTDGRWLVAVITASPDGMPFRPCCTQTRIPFGSIGRRLAALISRAAAFELNDGQLNCSAMVKAQKAL
nr:type II toxin-antitoxin system RelE/ParE family toxin [Bradyrhizobium diazoefficiens]